jgi:hypothetical protein
MTDNCKPNDFINSWLEEVRTNNSSMLENKILESIKSCRTGINNQILNEKELLKKLISISTNIEGGN